MTTTATEARSWVPQMTFGARLALVRQAMQWNMKEAAAKCGLPAQSWRQWEVYGHMPRRYVETVKLIAGATDVDYDWLLDGRSGGDGGGGVTTREYFRDTREIATVGDPHPSSSRRPVTRTRPRTARHHTGRSARPLATVAA